MDITLKFEEKDFKDFRSFESAVKKQLGNNIYVGTNSLCCYMDYPAALVARLRPYGEKIDQLEFDLTISRPDDGIKQKNKGGGDITTKQKVADYLKSENP